MLQCMEIADLTSLLRESGDQILDATVKLTLSNTLLSKINHSLREILNLNDGNRQEFNVSQTNATSDGQLDLIYLYDFIQKTLALKLLPDVSARTNTSVDIQLFKNLRLLEVQRLSASLIRGLRYVRSQLEYITCVKQSVNALGDVLEHCGADMQRGHVWNQLLSATFSYNSIEDIDGSLEFTPSLRSLDLSHNCIRNAYLINCLPNLECLNLASNKLDMFPSFTGSICNQLKVLILRNNLIEDILNLASLIRLEKLDLSYNCLLDHRQLLPLSNLAVLSCLYLQGNPLSYHKDHRKRTVSYLHINTTNNTRFLLDYSPLSTYETRQIGAFLFLEPAEFQPKSSPAHDSAISVSMSNSVLSTTNTSGRLDIIVDVHRSDDDFVYKVGESTADDVETDESGGSVPGYADLNQSSSVQTVIENILRDNVQVVLVEEERGMRDSGFEPGPGNNRMLPSPVDSIETIILPINNPAPLSSHSATTIPIFPRSASSLNDLESKQTVINCDSDIEILSNPSQSSIEVLSVTGPHNISATLVPSLRTFISTNNKRIKKRRNKEAHRSF